MAAATQDPAVRRRRALAAAVMILIMAGAAAVDVLVERADAWRAIDYVRLAAILVMALVISVRATTSMTLLPRVPALDDELTRANRASAAIWGFWTFFLVLVAAFVASQLLPVTLQELAPMVLVCGTAIAGLRFVLLERAGE